MMLHERFFRDITYCLLKLQNCVGVIISCFMSYCTWGRLWYVRDLLRRLVCVFLSSSLRFGFVHIGPLPNPRRAELAISFHRLVTVLWRRCTSVDAKLLDKVKSSVSLIQNVLSSFSLIQDVLSSFSLIKVVPRSIHRLGFNWNSSLSRIEMCTLIHPQESGTKSINRSKSGLIKRSLRYCLLTELIFLINSSVFCSVNVYLHLHLKIAVVIFSL